MPVIKILHSFASTSFNIINFLFFVSKIYASQNNLVLLLFIVNFEL